MATAAANTREVTVMRPVTETVDDGVVLTLTDDEAAALMAVLRRVGGTPAATRRGLIDAVLVALRGAGVPYGVVDDLKGRLTFS